ncbi:hypothetical protein MLD38_026794 [Melastoma candidum]|uniref:Uncharacterized protein n=1 Tax=Melastoma candidum TaxID=119954 RepID=A0ACB9P2M9_9MYRT|nr:hypothetical protein MLD38_026794 [Melastoma candidum]
MEKGDRPHDVVKPRDPGISHETEHPDERQEDEKELEADDGRGVADTVRAVTGRELGQPQEEGDDGEDDDQVEGGKGDGGEGVVRPALLPRRTPPPHSGIHPIHHTRTEAIHNFSRLLKCCSFSPSSTRDPHGLCILDGIGSMAG